MPPRQKKLRCVGKGKFRDTCCQGQPVSSSSARVVEPLYRGAIGLDQVLGMVCFAKESNEIEEIKDSCEPAAKYLIWI